MVGAGKGFQGEKRARLSLGWDYFASRAAAGCRFLTGCQGFQGWEPLSEAEMHEPESGFSLKIL